MSATTTTAEPQSAEAYSYRLVLGGRFALFADGNRDVTPKSRKCRAILAYLAVNAGERIRRERLIDLLWGDRFDAQARLSLRQALFEIRRTVGESLVCSDREHVWMDLSLLETEEDKGELFAGLMGITANFDEWLRIECERKTGEAFAKLNAEAQRLIVDGRGAAALPIIERMREIDPLHDACVRLAMKADHQAGNLSAVHKRFSDFSESLERELGVRPASETSVLHDWLIADLTKRPAETLRAESNSAGEHAACVMTKPAIAQPARGASPLLERLVRYASKRRLIYAAAAIVPFIFIAVAALQVAQRQRHEAETMAEVLLGNAKDALEPSGKINAIEDVASRVVDYYGGKPDSQLTDSELRQRSRALALLAHAQSMRGNTQRAIELYTQAAAGTQEEVRRKPDDPQRLFDHAQNVFWIGEIERIRGNTDAAESHYREYKRLAERMSALEPDNLKWRMEVLYANEDLGIVLYAKRNFAEAVNRFESALAPMQSVVSIDASKSDYQKELANVLGWLADSERASGRLDLAVAVRERQISLLEQAIALGVDDVDFHEKLVPAHEGLGVLYSEQGQIDRAISEHREALAGAQRLISLEPGNSMWTDVSANVRFELASNLMALGKNAEAAPQISAGCRAASDLLHRDGTVVRWRMLRTMCFSAASKLTLALGADAQAFAFAQQALAAARAENSGDQVRDRFIVASAYRLIGDVRRHSGDTAGAMAAWSAGLAQLPANAIERPSETSERAELLSRLGRLADVAAVEAHLRAMGYRRTG